MATGLRAPLVPRNGLSLQVLIVCRVSDPGPGKQDVRSLDDQEAMHRRWLEQHVDVPYDVKVIAGSGSGEWLERKEFLELTELVESSRSDPVLTEDLGRIVRRIHAHQFCELCVDNGVRLIAFNDHVDTADDGWQDRSIFSAWHHERSNRDTSDRIKRTHRNRFVHGGCAALPIFGYRKKPGAKSDADWEKIPEAEPIYQEWFRRLDEGTLYAEVADWMNSIGVVPGPHARSEKWDGPMVGRISHKTLLKGIRYRNKRKTERNSKGKYRSKKADAADLLTRHVPHLAFFDEAYYDRVIAKADARNAKYRRGTVNGVDPCARPRKRSRFPGQTLTWVLQPHLVREVTVDLFRPPQLVESRERVVELRREHTERAVAKMLGLTVTAAQRAAALQRLMDSNGLTDPYVRVFAPPEDLTKLRRHKHQRYRFEPLPGHTPG